MNTERVTIFLTFILIMLISASLLCIRITAPYDGYQGYSEAWYAQIAQNYDNSSWLEPTIDGETDLRVPPFYSYFLYFSYLMFGQQEWAMRLVSVMFGLMSVVLIFLIGRILYGHRAGLTSAALAAVSPVFILTCHNVQTDAMFLMCILTALYFILCFRVNDNPGTMIFAAVMYGCGLFTKQFAIIAVAAFILAEVANKRLGARFGEFKPARIFVTALIILVIPGHFYLYHLVKHPALLLLHNRHGAVTSAAVPGAGELAGIAAEAFFGIGPAAVVLCLACIVSSIIRKRMPEPHILFPLVLYAAFFAFLHKHTYYMLALVPFTCILAGQFISEARLKTAGAIIVSAAVAVGILHSVLTMGALKYGYERFSTVCGNMDSLPGKKILVVDHNIMSQFGPAVHYYCDDNEVVDKNVLATNTKAGFLRPEGGTRYFFLDYAGPGAAPAPFKTYQQMYYRSIYGASIFGNLLYMEPLSRNGKMRAFIPGELGVMKRDGGAPFQLEVARRYKSVVLTQLPPGFALYRNTDASVAAGSPWFRFVNLTSILPADEYEVDKKR